MAFFVSLDGNGLVVQARMGRTAPAGFLEVVPGEPGAGQVRTGQVPLLSELAEMMLVEGVLLPRPRSPQPYMAGARIIVPPCPEGTVITVCDMVGLEIMGEIITGTDDQDEVIELPDPGKYVVEVQAPPPFVMSKLELEI